MNEAATVAGCPATLQELVGACTHPHDVYDTLREHDRITFDPAGRCWLVTGHKAVREILGDGRFVSDGRLVAPQPPRTARRSFLANAIQNQVIFTDGPVQARVQRAVLVELSRRSDALAQPVRDAAVALAARARERGEVDLVRDFATPFSMHAISLILGLPAEDPEQIDKLERWSTTFADLTSGYLRADVEGIHLLGEYFRAQLAARGGVPSNDLIGAFMRDAGLADEEEVVIQCMMAFAAGRVTTQKLLGSGVALLLPRWGEWREMVAADAASLRRLAEELLRLVTPTRYLVRYATEAVRLGDGSSGGTTIQRGEKVVLFLEAANRDAHAFTDPHALQCDRQPNPHVAFGFGAHRCPGALVARMEVQLALQALLEALPELRPHPSLLPTWEPNPNLGGYASYPCICA